MLEALLVRPLYALIGWCLGIIMNELIICYILYNLRVSMPEFDTWKSLPLTLNHTFRSGSITSQFKITASKLVRRTTRQAL
jgi:hypothetical protein